MAKNVVTAVALLAFFGLVVLLGAKFVGKAGGAAAGAVGGIRS